MTFQGQLKPTADLLWKCMYLEGNRVECCGLPWGVMFAVLRAAAGLALYLQRRFPSLKRIVGQFPSEYD